MCLRSRELETDECKSHIKIYLFWLHGLFSSFSKQGLLFSFAAWVSHCSGFFCGAKALGLQAQQLWLPGSRAQAQ